MSKHLRLGWGAAFVVLSFMGGQGCHTAKAADNDQPPPAPAQEHPEALLRGPVHESFAQPVVTMTQEYVTSPSAPPANIMETPPDERPRGANVAWAPGYWAWDADRECHIWVSGCWRLAPPRMSWVSGYWARMSGHWAWIPGFWTPVGNQEIEYLPAPPELPDVAPPGEPIAVDTIWVPPCYYWSHDRYTLRRGYWLGAQSGWVWTPSHYIRTPRGYIFVAGHWDYELRRRGVLFAPVLFSPGFHVQVGFIFSPSVVIDVDLLTINLFVYPTYHHYYFGDYYDRGYISIGIYPWFEVESSRHWSDPIYEQHRWQHRRSDPNWTARLHRDYDDRREHKELRPARTYREMEVRLAAAPEPQRRIIEVARPLARVVASTSTTVTFEHVSPEARVTITQQAVDANKFREERNQWEAAKGPRTHGSSGKGQDKKNAPVAVEDSAATPEDRSRGSAAKPKASERDNDQPAATPPQQDPVAPAPKQRNSVAAPPSDRQESEPSRPQEDGPGRSDRVKIRSRPIADPTGGSDAPATDDNEKGPPASPSSEDNARDDSSKEESKGKGHDSRGKKQK